MEFKLQWREASLPNHHDDGVNWDQHDVNKALSLSFGFRGPDLLLLDGGRLVERCRLRRRRRVPFVHPARKVEIRLPEKGNSNFLGARRGPACCFRGQTSG